MDEEGSHQCRASRPTSPAGQQSWLRLTDTRTGKIIIYMLLSFEEANPVSQALYAVDASPPPILQQHKVNQSPVECIYPVFEFMSQDGFPNRMCCAILDSRIYFVGGYIAGDLSDGFPHRIFSEKVYYIDASDMPLTPTDPRSVLHEVASMTTGKPQCYCFVALGQLFALGVQDWSPPRKVFEVYDPKLNKWTPLPDPPITTFVVSDAIVDNMVILRTRTQDFYSFNAATHEWKNMAHLPYSTASCYGGVIRRGIFLDDTIFWNYFDTVISSGPTSMVDPADKVNDFMTQTFRAASGKLTDVIHGLQMYNCVSTRLQYLGNRTFASVICAAVENSENPYIRDCPGDPEMSKACIVVFEIPKEEEDATFEQAGGSQNSRFKVNILHTARFECRSNKGADHCGLRLEECFSDL